MNDEGENQVPSWWYAQRSSADAFQLNRHPPAERDRRGRTSHARVQAPGVTMEDEEEKPVRIGRDK